MEEQYYQDMGNAYEAEAQADANARAEYEMSQQPTSPKELLTLMANTSTQVDIFSDSIIQSVKNGELEPFTVLIHDRANKKAFERILNEIKPELQTASDKYPGKSFEYAGNVIEKAEHGTKYDYSNCGYSEWNKYNKEIEALTEKLKECETFLKALRSPIEILNPYTGEVEIVSPPTKKSTSGFNVKLK